MLTLNDRTYNANGVGNNLNSEYLNQIHLKMAVSVILSKNFTILSLEFWISFPSNKNICLVQHSQKLLVEMQQFSRICLG